MGKLKEYNDVAKDITGQLKFIEDSVLEEAEKSEERKYLPRRKPLEEIKLHPEFEKLFPINETTLQQVCDSMAKHGYDESQPVLMWKEEDVLIDGHTRKKAAEINNYFDIPYHEKSFQNIEEALEYALSLQVARRNLNDAELVNAVLRLDELKKRGVKKEGEDVSKGKSSEQLANLLNTNSRKIEKIRAINKDADEDVIEAVKKGEQSVEKAYKATREKVKKEKDIFKDDFIDEEQFPIEEEDSEITNTESINSKSEEQTFTLAENIQNKSIRELAEYLHGVQKTPLKSIIEWEDALKQKELFQEEIKPEKEITFDD